MVEQLLEFESQEQDQANQQDKEQRKVVLTFAIKVGLVTSGLSLLSSLILGGFIYVESVAYAAVVSLVLGFSVSKLTRDWLRLNKTEAIRLAKRLVRSVFLTSGLGFAFTHSILILLVAVGRLNILILISLILSEAFACAWVTQRFITGTLKTMAY
jgi:hypothetical protein